MTEARARKTSGGLRPARHTLLATIATLCLLSGVWAERVYLREAGADARTYHESIVRAAAKAPFHVGTWMGVDAKVPDAAITLLKPNVIISRRYQDIVTGRSATLLLVQCKLVRDMLGHYPPECYGNRGWEEKLATPMQWTVDDMTVQGTQYEFSSGRIGTPGTIVIDNFMIMPDGRTCKDMAEVEVSSQGVRQKHFGAAQFQLIYDASTTPDQRRELFEKFVRAYRPIIDSIRQQGQPQ